MNETPNWVYFLSIIAAMLLGILCAFHNNNKWWEMEAVKKGHATWATGDSGNAYFKWKEPSK